jgi:DNA-binding CsgD family transcriptional regulator
LQLSESFATIASFAKGGRMDRTDQSLIALRRILRATEIYGQKLANAAGVTAVQFRVLQIVAERGQTTATDIARRMRVSQATVTSLVDKLADWEQAQLVASLERIAAMLDADALDASPVLDTGDLRDAS